MRRKRCAGAFLDSGNFSQASGVCTLDRYRSGAFGGQHPDRRSEKNGEGLYLPVPVMSVLYLGSCLFLLVKNAAWIPAALQAIFVSAFSKKAVIGGIAGTAVKMAVRTGMAKGLFTNEAGMGSMPMTAAAAEGLSPRDQGLVSMTGVFWDTLVMCAVTALAILSDMVKNAAPYRAAAVDEYCFVAFSNLPVAGRIFCRSAWCCLHLRRLSAGAFMGNVRRGICGAREV